jgi:hypothetical protein
MAKAKAFDYVQVPLAIVATDLTGATVEAEGAYFRIARVLAVNGPMSLEAIRETIGGQSNRVERLLDHRSSDVEPLLSFCWVEEWRVRANASRERMSEKGRASAAKRAEKKTKKNKRSTHVEHQSNSGSTTVEHTTILSSTLNQEGEGKERAGEGAPPPDPPPAPTPVTDPRFEALWLAYERNGSKGKALDYWKKLPENDRTAIEAKVEAYVKSTPGGEFRLNLEGWINPAERRWERPIRNPKGTGMQAALHSADVPPDAYEA